MKALMPTATMPLFCTSDNIADDARKFLDWLMWTTAVILAADRGIDSQAEIAPLFDDIERREDLYVVTLQRLELFEGVLQSAVMQLLHDTRAENLYQLDGWQGVSGWALSHRTNLSESGGAWWAMGQIIDILLPWMADFMVYWDHRQFFDVKYLNRVIVVLPALVRVIEADHNEGRRISIQRVTELLSEAAKAKTKQDLIDAFQKPRFDKLLAWSLPGDNGSVRIVVLAPDTEQADRVLRRLRTIIDYQGVGQEIEG